MEVVSGKLVLGSHLCSFLVAKSGHISFMIWVLGVMMKGRGGRKRNGKRETERDRERDREREKSEEGKCAVNVECWQVSVKELHLTNFRV